MPQANKNAKGGPARLDGWNALYPGFCADSLSVGADGKLGKVRHYNNRAQILKPGGVWYTLPQDGTWTGNITVVDQHTAYLTKPNIALSNMFKANLDPNPNTITSVNGWASKLSATPNNVLWVIGGSNAVYYQDMNTMLGWTKLVGTMTDISVGGYVFALNGTTPYHYNSLWVNVYGRTYGSYDCQSAFPATGQCPTGSFHTAKITVAVPTGLHGTAGVSNSSSGVPASNLTAAASETANESCDPIFGDPQATNANSKSTGLRFAV